VSGYVIRGGVAGFERLQILARAHQPATTELLDRVGVGVGAHCLDVGCGSADVAFDLAQRVGPDGLVVGLDMDEDKLRLARDLGAERGLNHVRFERRRLDEWTLEGEAGAWPTYDLVFSRFVLQHLGDPVRLLATMWQCVAPGGVLVVVDADFDGLFCHPPNDGFAFWASRYPTVLRRHGGDPTIGRKLRSYFLEAGIPNPSMHLVQAAVTAGDMKQLPYLTVEATADAMVDAGLTTPEEVQQALVDLADFLSQPDTLIGDPRVFQVWAAREARDGP
jgi:ubiquinone/menaquinone biosynthesis C-methylase UbiE